LGKKGIHGEFHPMSCVYGDPEAVYVAPTAEVHPMVVLDTKHGPVIVEDGAVVFPHTRIEGPGVIGPGTQIVGGKIREGCTIGPVCRVGGEVEESIIHGYSNKYHDGFLGHAYVGEWVNLGGITTNSDLKNDYSSVQVYVRGELMDSGSTKVGSFIGDHTKTSIGTYLNTGTVLGVGCNILASGGVLTLKYIPSFCWFFNNHLSKGYGLAQMIQTAKVVTSRRKRELTPEEIAVLEHVHALTKDERNEMIKKSRQQQG
jgi:UDP-N-acetylglucosamine diphosphorylase/glucosamine-1-phosphate N-acetyltransferase